MFDRKWIIGLMALGTTLACDKSDSGAPSATGALTGTPAQAAERVLEYVAAGASEINIALRAPWNQEALDAYIEDVVPRVRNATR